MKDILVQVLLARCACTIKYNTVEQTTITCSYRYPFKPEAREQLKIIRIQDNLKLFESSASLHANSQFILQLDLPQEAVAEQQGETEITTQNCGTNIYYFTRIYNSVGFTINQVQICCQFNVNTGLQMESTLGFFCLFVYLFLKTVVYVQSQG